jgi:tetratricopeptide (TPR) repeat protein
VGEFELALRVHATVLERRRIAAAAGCGDAARLEYARSLRRHGDALDDLGLSEEARREWTKALELLRELHHGEAAAERAMEEAAALLGIARQYQARGMWSDWRGFASMALQAMEGGAEVESDRDLRLIRGRIHLQLALATAERYPEESVSWCTRGVSALESMQVFTTDVSSAARSAPSASIAEARVLAMLLLTRARLHRGNGNRPEAERDAEAAERSVLRCGEPPLPVPLACAATEAASELARLRRTESDAAAASPDLERAASYLASVPAALTGIWRLQHALARGRLGVAALECGASSLAAESLEIAIAGLRAVPRPVQVERNTHEAQIVHWLMLLGDARRLEGRVDLASQAFEDVVSAFDALGRTSDVDERRLCFALAGLAGLDRSSERRSDQVRAAVKFASALVGRSPQFEKLSPDECAQFLGFSASRLHCALELAVRGKHEEEVQAAIAVLEKVAELQSGADPVMSAWLSIDGIAPALKAAQEVGCLDAPRALEEFVCRAVGVLHDAGDAVFRVTDGSSGDQRLDAGLVRELRAGLTVAAEFLKARSQPGTASQATAAVERIDAALRS